MTGTSATSMFAALLDRSVAHIGELAADGRRFDRQTIATIADVWDNNTFALFTTALTRPGWWRERRAKAALAWMADFGPSRRAWMIEQAAIAGHRLEPLLPRTSQRAVHYRDHLGRVQPGITPLTASAVADIAKDYDLARAEVRAVTVERAGDELRGHVALAASRRYASPGEQEDPVVRLFLTGVQTVRFDSGDKRGATLTADAATVEVRVGSRSHLRAASATVGFDDPSWHLSHIGRIADAGTPHGRPAGRKPGHGGRTPMRDGARDAAIVLHQAMLEIRSVRYAKLVGRIPLPQLCNVLAGADTDVLTAARQPPATRDHTFRRLAEKWIAGSPRLAGRTADRFADDHWTRTMVPDSPPPSPVVDLPTKAQLTLATYTAPSAPDGALRNASTMVNLAVPDRDGTWGLRAVSFPEPASLSLDTAAFTTAHDVSYTPGVSLVLGRGAFAVTCSRPGPDDVTGKVVR
ncbi:hypothetical protein [Micromonospora echinofusca]|uniref:Uncharacterized protein n=1 Tax=Micromonospora echinofusca TaxID=47858 RepID=A0ABS3VYG2_MICEH|nr:hypothetical protein [Micromonospora echinofusca]MBO4209579.1 hypothetical protein [Micromonospora echinofusca]